MNPDNEFATAIEAGDVEAIRSFIATNPAAVDGPGWTPPPLHCAVLWNQPAVAEVLLDNGADIERRDPDADTTPLRYAVMYAKPQLIRLLIAPGANSGPIKDNGTTALQLAKNALAGEFKDFEDLPRPKEYAAIVKLLEELT